MLRLGPRHICIGKLTPRWKLSLLLSQVISWENTFSNKVKGLMNPGFSSRNFCSQSRGEILLGIISYILQILPEYSCFFFLQLRVVPFCKRLNFKCIVIYTELRLFYGHYREFIIHERGWKKSFLYIVVIGCYLCKCSSSCQLCQAPLLPVCWPCSTVLAQSFATWIVFNQT